MKVTNTSTETIMYDTNGKKISIVREEILEIDSQPHLLTREESRIVKQKVTVYKENLTNAKKVKNQLEKLKGTKEGCKVFNSMADLIMVVENPVTINFETETKKNLDNYRMHSIIEAANTTVGFFKEGPKKKKKKII